MINAKTMPICAIIVHCFAVCSSFSVFAASHPPPEDWRVAIDPSAELGPIKPMNAVNGGPTVRSASNSTDWRHARIPFGRTHDMNHSWEFGGPHAIDIAAVFPDFDADENDPDSYDFVNTDICLEQMIACGTEPFYRLGPSIEGGKKRYYIHPPKDFAKWARICEHIIMHCNEGWANGKHMGIRYWEIWNEPDLSDKKNWSGTKEQFLELYKVASRYLKGRFPALKIGGPAFSTPLSWKDDFIPFCQREKLPLDFYSWHCYAADPQRIGRGVREVREWLDAHGFQKAESVFNEWNYVHWWSGGEWKYSREVESGRFIQKGAAFAAAVMAECQNAPVDLAMYYDTRLHGGMNMLFDSINARAMKGYYPFYAWGKLLRDYGKQVVAKVDAPGNPADQLFVTAAKDARGNLAVWLARYSDDNNVFSWRNLRLCLPKDYSNARIVCHMTDDICTYTEIAIDRNADGLIELTLVPNSFAFVEASFLSK